MVSVFNLEKIKARMEEIERLADEVAGIMYKRSDCDDEVTWLPSERFHEVALKIIEFLNPNKAAQSKGGWVSVEDLPPVNTVVLGYSLDWVDEDYEPEGIRECFLHDYLDGETPEWSSCEWNNSMDEWVTDTETKPTYWMQRPTPPTSLKDFKTQQAIYKNYPNLNASKEEMDEMRKLK